MTDERRPPRRTNAGGAKKRPTRYGGDASQPTSTALANALRLHRHGAFEHALEAYRAVLGAEPDSVDGWMNLAAVSIALGRAQDAREAFSRAVGIAPGDARVLRDEGIGRASLGDWAEARRALEASIARDASQMGARLALVRVCMEGGDGADAIAHATDAVELDPDNASTQLELARVSFIDNAPADAIAAATRAVALDPEYAHARYLLAGALVFAGQSDRATAVVEHSSLSEALRTSIAYLAEHHIPSLRAFASTRDTLRFALAQSSPEGVILEFGVRHGISTRVLAAATADRVDAFDSFVGLPSSWAGKSDGAFSTAGELPIVPANVTLHRGWFDHTLPPFVTTLSAPIRLVHIDSDLYESARTVLFALAPHVHPGCVIVFDEYIGNRHWRDDEFRAFREACETFGWRYEYLALCWITGQAVVRIATTGARAVVE